MINLIAYAPEVALVLVMRFGLFGYLIALGLAAFFSKHEGSLGARLAA